MISDLIKENRKLRRQVDKLSSKGTAAASTTVERGLRTIQRRVQRALGSTPATGRRRTTRSTSSSSSGGGTRKATTRRTSSSGTRTTRTRTTRTRRSPGSSGSSSSS